MYELRERFLNLKPTNIDRKYLIELNVNRSYSNPYARNLKCVTQDLLILK